MENKNAEQFVEELVSLGQQLKEIYQTGDISLLTKMNRTVKEMHRLQSGSEEEPLKAVDEECKVIYQNFDMIIAILRTTENGEVDQAAGGAIGKFLHNINAATVNVASMFNLV